jgi:cytohesin
MKTMEQYLCLRLRKAADVNAKNKNGLTGLMLAAMDTGSEIVQMLIDAGADLNAKDKHGITALMVAANNPNPTIIRTLIAAGG